MTGLGPLDLVVVLGTLVAVTLVGGLLAGRQADVHDFFLGGRRLPWWAVAASIVATEISAVTYVSLPSVVWREGGDLTYLQIGLIGAVLAKVLVALLLLPAYFEREIYSPYDFMGRRLGEGVRRTTTALFALGGVLGQAARVYLIAVVLEVLLARELSWLEARTGLEPLAGAVLVIGLIATAWTLIGGIAAIVWTDALLFLLFLVGIAVLLLSAAAEVEGGLWGALRVGAEAGKLDWLDTTPTLFEPYTLWVALIAAPIWLLGPYGTDQLIVQRLFACRDAREARKAMLASTVATLVTLAVGLVGVALYASLEARPLDGEASAMLVGAPDRVVPVYVLARLPDGLRGLVVAGVFAAAISSLDSILSALAQTSLALLGRGDDADGRQLRRSRVLVVAWAFVLCFVAVGLRSAHERFGSILDLALASATYTAGALIAGFFLAFLPTGRDGRGVPWASALSVAAVVALAWPEPEHQRKLWVGLGLLVVAWVLRRLVRPAPALGPAPARHTAWFLAGVAVVALLGLFAHGETAGGAPRPIAYPWTVPVGVGVAFAFGTLLSERTNAGGTSIERRGR